MRAGAPRVHLQGLELRSQIAVEGSEVSIAGCAFVDSRADEGGALAVRGGAVTANGTRFVGSSARRGGAVRVSGGEATEIVPDPARDSRRRRALSPSAGLPEAKESSISTRYARISAAFRVWRHWPSLPSGRSFCGGGP